MAGSLDIGNDSSAQGQCHLMAPALKVEGGCGAASSCGGGEALVGDRDLRRRDGVRWRQDEPTRRTCAVVLLISDKGNDGNSAQLALSGTAVVARGRKAPTVHGGRCRLRQ
jgi:hypothetical protein